MVIYGNNSQNPRGFAREYDVNGVALRKTTHCHPCNKPTVEIPTVAKLECGITEWCSVAIVERIVQGVDPEKLVACVHYCACNCQLFNIHVATYGTLCKCTQYVCRQQTEGMSQSVNTAVTKSATYNKTLDHRT